MTDLYKLLDANKDVAVFPDPGTADRLRKLRNFWDGSDDDEVANEPDLSSLSDVEIREQLDALGVTDIELPARTRNLLNSPQASQPWGRKLTIAACLVGGVGVGIFGITESGSNSPGTAPDQIAESGLNSPDTTVLDSYLVLPRDPVRHIAPEVETDPGIRTVRLPEREERLNLDRAELRELQFLLNQFEFGPVEQFGLPSLETDRAIVRFREAHDLAEGGTDRIVLEILRELAHKQALQNRYIKDGNNPRLKGDTQ